MKNVTIYDVAKEVGCSTATVSLALAGDTRIRPKTIARVTDVAEKLGYIPNYTAKSLSKKTTDTLGLIVPNVENPLFSMMISGIESFANSKKYDLILGISDSDKRKEIFYLDMLRSKRVDGLIVFPTYIDSISERLTNSSSLPPLVLCGSSGNRIHNTSYAKCNNRRGAYLATEHLIKCGCKKIACVFPVRDAKQYASRYNGCCEAMQDAGITPAPDFVYPCSPDNESIFNTTVNLIKNFRPDGIFCLCDYHAITVMRAIAYLGMKIPEDIQLIGFDNIGISEFLPTPLSTIDTRGYQVGQTAAELLIEKINNPTATVKRIEIEPQLIIRNSTCVK